MRYAKQIQNDIVRRGRNAALVVQSGCCKYCFEPLTEKTVTAEHRVPRSQGGSNLAHNIDAACLRCNRLKGTATAGAFLKAIKSPAVGADLELLLAHARRKIWLKTHRSCRAIGRAVGMAVVSPVGAQ